MHKEYGGQIDIMISDQSVKDFFEKGYVEMLLLLDFNPNEKFTKRFPNLFVSKTPTKID